MTEEQFKKILKQLECHEKRICVLENGGNKKEPNLMGAFFDEKKKSTLSELIFGRKFKNGQEKIAVIVGYLEKLEQKLSIQEVDIKQGWKDGKFEGDYANELLRRATKNLVRDLKNDTYDLSQTGERFFNDFLKLDA